MEMSNLSSKLKVRRLELGEDMLLYLFFISLPVHTLGNSKWVIKKEGKTYMKVLI